MGPSDAGGPARDRSFDLPYVIQEHRLEQEIGTHGGGLLILHGPQYSSRRMRRCPPSASISVQHRLCSEASKSTAGTQE